MVRPLSESTFGIKIGLALLLLTLLIFIVGFSTTDWKHLELPDGIVSSGLWQRCGETDFDGDGMEEKHCDYFPFIGVAFNYLVAVEILESVGLSGFILATVAILVNIFLVRKKRLKQVTLIIIFLSGSVVIVGCALYAANLRHYSIGYSYILSLSGGCGAFTVGVFLCLDIRNETMAESHVVSTPTAQYTSDQPITVSINTNQPEGEALMQPPTSGQA